MIDFENNPAIGMSWDDYVKENMTPEEIAEMKFDASIICALADARDEGKITVAELEKIEEIEEPSLWRDEALRVLFSLGKTFVVAPVEQNKAS